MKKTIGVHEMDKKQKRLHSIVMEYQKTGNERLFSQIHELCENSLSHYCHKQYINILTPDEIQDVIQLSWVKAYKSFHLYNPEIAGFVTWLKQVAYSVGGVAANKKKKDRSKTVQLSQYQNYDNSEGAQTDRSLELSDPTVIYFDGRTGYTKAEMKELFISSFKNKVIEELNKRMTPAEERNKTVLILVFLENLTYEEVGNIFGFSDKNTANVVFKYKKLISEITEMPEIKHMMAQFLEME